MMISVMLCMGSGPRQSRFPIIVVGLFATLIVIEKKRRGGFFGLLAQGPPAVFRPRDQCREEFFHKKRMEWGPTITSYI